MLSVVRCVWEYTLDTGSLALLEGEFAHNCPEDRDAPHSFDCIVKCVSCSSHPDAYPFCSDT